MLSLFSLTLSKAPPPPVITSNVFLITPATSVNFCISGPVDTPNSFANSMNDSRLSIAPDWMNAGPARCPKISAALAARSSAPSTA